MSSGVRTIASSTAANVSILRHRSPHNSGLVGIDRLYENERFYDVVIYCEPIVKRLHNCLLTARVPNLYKELLCHFRCKHVPYGELDSISCETSCELVYIKVTPSAVESSVLVEFLNKVYTDNDIRKEEVNKRTSMLIMQSADGVYVA